MTSREELIKENSRLETLLREAKDADAKNRTEFAKAFKWIKKHNPYHAEDEYHTPTWIEIFVELGKLLAAQKFVDVNSRINNIELNIENLRKEKTFDDERTK